MVRNVVLVLLILYGSFCFAIEDLTIDKVMLKKTIQEYNKCSSDWKKTRRYGAKSTDKHLMMEGACQLTKAQTIAEYDFNDPSTREKARRELESSMSNIRRIVYDVGDRSLRDRKLLMKARIGTYLDLFDNKHISKLDKKRPDGIINSQGIRTFYFEVQTENPILFVRYLKKKLSEITNLEFYCNNQNTPKHCEFHVANKDGSLVEKYIGIMKDSMAYYRLSPPLTENLMALSIQYTHLPNLATGDYETMALANNYKGSIEQMYFWFARYYAEYCSRFIDRTRTISGKWQQIVNQSVKDEMEYSYPVETTFYEMAKQSHDQFVNYQVFSIIALKYNIDAMTTFFDTYTCDSKEVKNVRKGLFVIGNNMDVLSGSVFYNNKLKLVSIN